MTKEFTFTCIESSGEAKIHILPLEVFPNFWASVYLVQKNELIVLIDAGSGTDKSHQDFLQGLESVGVQPSDLSHILITRAHIDHFGGHSKLRPLTQARIGVHELDLQKSISDLQYWVKDARWILNSHTEAITDLTAHIEATRENIRRRMGKEYEAVREPLTFEEVSTAIYGNMDGYNQLLVVEKTGAYVESLYEHGSIEISNPNELEQRKPGRDRRLQEVSESDLLPKEIVHVFI